MKLYILLKGELKRRGWTQSRAARELGLAQATLSNLLKGTHGAPSFSTLVKLSEGLGISSRRLMEATLEEASTTETERKLDMELRDLKREFQEAIDALLDAEFGEKKKGLAFYRERLGDSLFNQVFDLPRNRSDVGAAEEILPD